MFCVALASFCFDPDVVEDTVKMRRCGAEAGPKDEFLHAEGVFPRGLGYAVRGLRRHRVAITLRPREGDRGDCEE